MGSVQTWLAIDIAGRTFGMSIELDAFSTWRSKCAEGLCRPALRAIKHFLKKYRNRGGSI